MAFPTAVNNQITDAELISDFGPLVGNAIITERSKNGPFKNGVDLATRVGLSQKLVSELEAKGLITVAV